MKKFMLGVLKFLVAQILLTGILWTVVYVGFPEYYTLGQNIFKDFVEVAKQSDLSPEQIKQVATLLPKAAKLQESIQGGSGAELLDAYQQVKQSVEAGSGSEAENQLVDAIEQIFIDSQFSLDDLKLLEQ